MFTRWTGAPPSVGSSEFAQSMQEKPTASRTRSFARESPLKADARKYCKSLHSLSEYHWYELTSADCPDRVEPGLN